MDKGGGNTKKSNLALIEQQTQEPKMLKHPTQKSKPIGNVCRCLQVTYTNLGDVINLMWDKL